MPVLFIRYFSETGINIALPFSLTKRRDVEINP